MRVIRDWYDDAIEAEQKQEKWSGENHSRARIFAGYRVDR